jgi:maleylacetoacetate isomerase
MKLYTWFRSSAAFRVRIALNLKGISYDKEPIALPRAAHRKPEYAALNPQALVPTLEEGGQLLTQSLAIIEYLEEKQPSPPLLPVDLLGRARVRALSLLVACEIHPLNNLRVLKYLHKPLGLSEDASKAWYQHWIADGFQKLGGGAAARRDRQVLPRRCAEHGRLLPGAAGVQRATLPVRSGPLPDG